MNNHNYIHLPPGHGRHRPYWMTLPPINGPIGAFEPPQVIVCRLVRRSDCPHKYRFFPKLFVVGRQNGSMFNTAKDVRRFYDMDRALHGELQVRSALRLPLTGAQLKELRAIEIQWGLEKDLFARDGSGTLPTHRTPIRMGEYFTKGRWVGVEMDGPKGRTLSRAWLPTGPSVVGGACMAAAERDLAARQEDHEEEGGRDDATIDREWGLAFASVSEWTAGSEHSTLQDRALLYLHQTSPRRRNDPLTETPYELMWASSRAFIVDWANSRAGTLESRQPAVPQEDTKGPEDIGKAAEQSVGDEVAPNVLASGPRETGVADKPTANDDATKQAWAALRSSIEELKKGMTAERSEAYEAARRAIRKLFDDDGNQ